jgi:mgtE-like transporter
MARAGRGRSERPGDRGPRSYLAHWRAESRSIRTSLTALGLGLAATLVAGIVLAAGADRIAAVPGLLALIPAAIGMRGSTFGAFGSRLATGILTGEYEPGGLRRGWLGRQVRAVAILSVVSSAQAGLLAWAVASVVGLPTVGPLRLIAISMLGGLGASVFLTTVVLGLARRSSQRGWSLDDVAAPVVTATGDLVTLPALLLASLVLDAGRVADVIGGLGLLVGVALAVAGMRDRDGRVRRIVRESVAVLSIAVTIDVLAGVAVEARIEQQFTAAALLIMLPPFIAKCGELGGMLASRLASRLHMGTLEPSILPGHEARLDLSLTLLFAAVAFTGVGATTFAAAVLVPGVEPLALASTLAVALLAGVFAVPILSTVAYAAATVSFRHGLDPDNHGIPIVTATMDLAGVLCLVAAATLLQVGG